MSIDRWMDRENRSVCACVWNGIYVVEHYSALYKKEEA